ncbi:hypothetical protein FRC00_010893 [Tulasnella sp. 408]|nr:hypothetical protein FRC00_010893 [Tulasnella sp. 408]
MLANDPTSSRQVADACIETILKGEAAYNRCTEGVEVEAQGKYCADPVRFEIVDCESGEQSSLFYDVRVLTLTVIRTLAALAAVFEREVVTKTMHGRKADGKSMLVPDPGCFTVFAVVLSLGQCCLYGK